MILLSMMLAAQALTVPLRTRVEVFDQWREARMDYALDPKRTAIIICDMWDKHWCRGATERVGPLAAKAAPVIKMAREKGMLIIHAPSDTMDAYAESPQRKAIQQLAAVNPPAVPKRSYDGVPGLPIDDSDGGCDTAGDKMYRAWSKQHAGIPIDARDLISDKGSEVYSALKLRGIETLLVVGVHTNMCILNRTFAIKQMTKWGVNCILVRDLTDSMYDPKDKPHVSHDQGTQLVVEYIEKYWAPSMLSSQLTEVLRGALIRVERLVVGQFEGCAVYQRRTLRGLTLSGFSAANLVVHSGRGYEPSREQEEAVRHRFSVDMLPTPRRSWCRSDVCRDILSATEFMQDLANGFSTKLENHISRPSRFASHTPAAIEGVLRSVWKKTSARSSCSKGMKQS